MASSSRSVSSVWPRLFGYRRATGMRNDRSQRAREEFLSCLGIVSINEARIGQNMPPFTYATILTGLHESSSDTAPHITLAVATSDMMKQKQHCVMHSRASSAEIMKANFVEGYVYSSILKDDETLRQSYRKPNHARTSLMPEGHGAETFPVGHVVDADGITHWYVLNGYGRTVYIQTDFYTAGEGSREHMVFLHPELNRPVKAKFFGLERPVPVSPNREPVNLEAGMSSLNLTDQQSTEEYEWVHLAVKFGNNMRAPLRCDTKGKSKVKTGWDEWEFLQEESVFECEKDNKILRCPVVPDGAEEVDLAYDSRYPKPIYFRNKGGVILYTALNHWHSGKNNSFCVYLEGGVYYLAFTWPEEDQAYPESTV